MSVDRDSIVNRTVLIPLALAALLAVSCEATNDVIPIPPPPVAHAPTGAMFLLEWSWDNRQYVQLPGLFTEDYRFVFADMDSAGNAYRTVPWSREDELIASNNCFNAARSITLALDQSPVVLDDDRLGKDPRWHKTIQTEASMQAVVMTNFGPVDFAISGQAKFYFVRGDSALIPPELVAQGYTPDSTLWWIDRWEDQTYPGTGVSAHPTKRMSWGAFKVLFR